MPAKSISKNISKNFKLYCKQQFAASVPKKGIRFWERSQNSLIFG
jgi:hypothetical protein